MQIILNVEGGVRWWLVSFGAFFLLFAIVLAPSSSPSRLADSQMPFQSSHPLPPRTGHLTMRRLRGMGSNPPLPPPTPFSLDVSPLCNLPRHSLLVVCNSRLLLLPSLFFSICGRPACNESSRLCFLTTFRSERMPKPLSPAAPVYLSCGCLVSARREGVLSIAARESVCDGNAVHTLDILLV